MIDSNGYPRDFVQFLFGLLALYVIYLLLPRGFRVHHFGSYPRRYAWSDRTLKPRRKSTEEQGGRDSLIPNRTSALGTDDIRFGSNDLTEGYFQHKRQSGTFAMGLPVPPWDSDARSAVTELTGTTGTGGDSLRIKNPSRKSIYRPVGPPGIGMHKQGPGSKTDPAAAQETVLCTPSRAPSSATCTHGKLANSEIEVAVSAAIQELRDPGKVLVAHGSKGRAKCVRLKLTVRGIAWRTETVHTPGGRRSSPEKREPKLGKLHQVPFENIMYVDIGKQTTALRRVENASISGNLCFSLLTREGSLDLEAKSPGDRDALVNAFSLVLDEVHLCDWRDIEGKAPSMSDMHSFDRDGEIGLSKGIDMSPVEA